MQCIRFLTVVFTTYPFSISLLINVEAVNHTRSL
jgi:hypothetical protein